MRQGNRQGWGTAFVRLCSFDRRDELVLDEDARLYAALTLY